MCNINFIVKKNKGSIDLINFVNTITNYSYKHNSDGDGTYFNTNNLLVKSDKKINLLKYPKEIIESNFILSHQRLATHGLTKKYTQPFQSERFVFLHNGVMSEFSNGVYSDSYGFFKKFIKKFNKSKSIAEAIKKLIDKKLVGSYSILIFDKEKKELYYFKNDLTLINFYFSKDRKFLFGTTNRENKSFLDIIYPKKKFIKFKIKNNQIYKINISDKIKIRKISKINNPPFKENSFLGDFSFFEESNKKQKSKKDYEIIKDFSNVKHIKKTKNENNFCDICGEKTNNASLDLSNETLCNSCLEEHGYLIKEDLTQLNLNFQENK